MAQVSINIDNYKITPPHVVFEECVKDAKKIKVAVCGSELVGLIPLEAMLMAANYYIKEEDLFILDERQKIRVAIDRLGLNSISQFIPERRIIEYMIDNLSNLSDSSDSSDLLDLKSEKSEGNLASMKLKEFIELVGSRSSAPGGGSVSAVAASLGAALGTMMGLLSYGSKKFEKIEPQMRKYIPPLHDAMQKLVPLIDEDTNAFTDYMLALKLPKNTEQEKKLRNEKIQEGLKKAVNVPLSVMRIADSCWKSMLELAKLGNISSSSDLAVGAKCLEAGIWGAYKNVEINIPQIEDKKFKKLIIKEANQILKRAEVNLKKIITTLKKRKS